MLDKKRGLWMARREVSVLVKLIDDLPCHSPLTVPKGDSDTAHEL